MNGKVIGAQVVKHLPQIFSILSMIGVGATAFCSGRDSVKAFKILQERDISRMSKELSDLEDSGNYNLEEAREILKTKEISFKDKIKLTWKCYIPTGIAVVSTITCLALADRMSAAQVASMGAACGYLAKLKKDADKRRQEESEEEKAELYSKIIEPDEVELWAEATGNGNQIVFESYSGRWFLSSEEAVNEGIKAFQEIFSTEDYISMNDYYNCLGIRNSYFGNEFGWCTDEEQGYSDKEISISTYHSNTIVPGKDVLVIEFSYPCCYPYEGWMEL